MGRPRESSRLPAVRASLPRMLRHWLLGVGASVLFSGCAGQATPVAKPGAATGSAAAAPANGAVVATPSASELRKSWHYCGKPQFAVYTAAMQAEARNTVGQIARKYANVYSGEHRPTPSRFAALPAVPSMVPSGVKYQSAPADWEPWSEIHFSMAEPQYYQYEVVVSKDGMSAEVIARGDLDGNGTQSRFSLTLKRDAKTRKLQLAPAIEESNPNE